MPLLSVDEARALVETALSDAQLGAVIAREEAEAARRFGPIGDGATPRTVVLEAIDGQLFLPTAAAAVSSINGASVPAGVTVLGPQGRVVGGRWEGRVTVVYVPADERERWKSVLVEIVRHAVTQTALRGESVAGEYSYQAPDWEAQRHQLYRRLKFFSV